VSIQKKPRLYDFEFDEGFLPKELDSDLEWKRAAGVSDRTHPSTQGERSGVEDRRFVQSYADTYARRRSFRGLDGNVTQLALLVLLILMVGFLFRYWGNAIHAVREAPTFNPANFGKPAPPPPLPEYLPEKGR